MCAKQTIMRFAVWQSLLWCLAVHALEAGAPRLVFAAQQHSFGRVSSGQLLTHEFVFTNAGSATLKILAVKPSCGCTTGGVIKPEIEPGEAGVIKLEINSAGFHGTVSKSTTILSNDPQQPEQTLELVGEFRVEYEVKPQAIMVHGNKETWPTLRPSVHIRNLGSNNLVIHEIRSDNPALVPTLVTNVPGREYDLAVSVGAFDENHNYGTLTLFTSLSNLPAIVVPVLLFSGPVITCEPREIVLDAAALTNATPVAIDIINRGTNRVQLSLQGASAASPVTLKTIKPGLAYRVEYDHLKKPADPDPLTEVVILTDRSDFPRITIPIRRVGYSPLPH